MKIKLKGNEKGNKKKNQDQESGRKKTGNKMQVFRKKKASEKTYLAYTRGCHISEKTSKQQNFLQQKQKFGSNLSFFFTKLFLPQKDFHAEANDTALSKRDLIPVFIRSRFSSPLAEN